MRRAFAVVITLLLFACGGNEKPATNSAADKPKTPPPPTTAAAKELIANSAEFSDYQFTNAAYTLAMKKSLMNEPAKKAAEELRDAGWIKYEGDEVQLTEKSGDDKRFVIRPNGYLDLVPIAKKEFLDVTAVRPNSDGTIAADFTWKWLPNEVGQAFKTGFVHDRFAAPEQRATAKLMWDGSNWTILRIDEVK